jgi:hypothetical protein
MITKISPSNEALKFIEERIKDKNYRGNISSQHNRYDMEDVIYILKQLNEFAPNKELMQIRTTDMSKREEVYADEVIYEKFCNKIKEKLKIGSQDAMRKNLFVDFNRMGFIERYDKNKLIIQPFKKSKIKYVSLTDFGIKLIREPIISNQLYIYSKGIDNLLGGFITILLDIFYNYSEIKYISDDEYTLFVSAVDANTNYKKTISECYDLIMSYRTLSRVQKKQTIEFLKKELNPKKFCGNKTEKRDFHNWENKNQQIIHLIKQTKYFDYSDNKLSLKCQYDNVTNNTKMKRSKSVVAEYFCKHKIDKTIGFELHHVIPLVNAETDEQYKLYDNWENLVYIDGGKHSIITQSKNKFIIMSNEAENILLSDYFDEQIKLINKKNVLYNVSLINEMLDYNKKLLSDNQHQ